MKHDQITKVRAEVNRLMKAIDELQIAAPNAEDSRNGYYYGYPRLTASVRRASMDVTRALADLRRAD